MISIVILSYRSAFLNSLLENISKTIGNSQYETLIIENTERNHSLGSGYNEAVKKAKGDYLCFVHEDVLFRSQDWGKEFISAMLANHQLGLVGVMGSKFKSAFPTGWYNPVNNCVYHTGSILQGGNNYNNVEFVDFSPGSTMLDKVVCLDGVLLFTKKEIVKTLRFDDVLLKGFHGYDIDFSLQVYFAGYEVAVLKSVKLLHYSSGNADIAWEDVNKLISDKWAKKLPASVGINSNFVLILRELETIYIHGKGSRYLRFLKALVALSTFLLRKPNQYRRNPLRTL